MLAALLFGHALAHAPPPCRCEPAREIQGAYEEIRLGSDFFVGEGGVGPAYAAPVYGGVYVVEGVGGFGGGFVGGFSGGFAGARASASASASARASARVNVRVVGGAQSSRFGGGR